jgi:hypothetical protein
MGWYSEGAVNVINGSNTITGTGVNFTANVRVGDAFLGPDGAWYEVTNVPSNVTLSISPNYMGASASTQEYKLTPIQGYVKNSADLLREVTIDLAGRLDAIDELDADELIALNGIAGNIQDQLDSKLGSNLILENTTASFTEELETKLNSIDADAQVNVQADWNALSGDSFILNKPVLVSIATSGSASDLIAGTISDSRLPSLISDKTFAGTIVLPMLTSIGNVSSIELQYLDGVTAPIQEQINNKQPLSDVLTSTSASFTLELEAKLNSVEGNATNNAPDSFLVNRANHTGTQAQSTITGLETALAGKQTSSSILTNTTASFTAAYEMKINSVQSGATSNSTDSFLLNRLNHTGTQTAESISNFDLSVQSKVASMLQEGSNISLSYDELGGTILISASGSGGGGGGSTDLSSTKNSTSVTIVSSSGTPAVLTAASATDAGIFTAANFTKLSNIATAATANQTDGYLLSRSNHTGTQAQSTITGLETAISSKQDILISAANIKTVNGNSLLGSGDLSVETSPFDSSTDPFILDIYLLALAAQ